MVELPDEIDLNYLAKINPAYASSQAVARTVNVIIRYLKENDAKLRLLPDFSKSLDDRG